MTNTTTEERMEDAGDRWNADWDRIVFGPRDEAFVRRMVENSEALEEMFRSVANRWYQIRHREAGWRQSNIPHDARHSVDGDTVRWTWSNWFHGDSGPTPDSLEYPTAWTWDDDWETKALARRDEIELAEREANAAKERMRASERLANAKRALEYAEQEAKRKGVGS